MDVAIDLHYDKLWEEDIPELTLIMKRAKVEDGRMHGPGGEGDRHD